MEKELTEARCGDCVHCRLSGWWDRSYYCEVDSYPVRKDGGACISFEINIVSLRKVGEKSNN